MHRCLFRGCAKNIPAEYAMCGQHWGLLPDEHKRRIRGAYSPGQSVATASGAWFLAIAKAEAWITETFGGQAKEPDRGRWERLVRVVRARDEARAAARAARGDGSPRSHLTLVP